MTYLSDEDSFISKKIPQSKLCLFQCRNMFTAFSIIHYLQVPLKEQLHQPLVSKKGHICTRLEKVINICPYLPYKISSGTNFTLSLTQLVIHHSCCYAPSFLTCLRKGKFSMFVVSPWLFCKLPSPPFFFDFF